MKNQETPNKEKTINENQENQPKPEITKMSEEIILSNTNNKLEKNDIDMMRKETLSLSHFQNLVEKSKTDLSLLCQLKNLSVEFKDFELASILRTVEKENFPLTDEEIITKERVKQLELLFRMVDISFSDESVYYVIDEVLKKFNELGGAFRISDASIIKANREKLFKR